MKTIAVSLLLSLSSPLGLAAEGPISSGGGMESPYQVRAAELAAILESREVSDAFGAMTPIDTIRFMGVVEGKSRFEVLSRRCSAVVQVSFEIQGGVRLASVRIHQNSCFQAEASVKGMTGTFIPADAPCVEEAARPLALRQALDSCRGPVSRFEVVRLREAFPPYCDQGGHCGRRHECVLDWVAYCE